ncbi:penicillin acylase family protein [Pyxidicoccus trucidator]|uniref:penicillin acylase family protein n=1 Tax=Pyxidicoccus trucidator TaxID=2709662 RepID=UPI0013DA63E3|nr:penicillin acylase family protein [Pyxidicoccus trucidator]
MHSTHPVSPPRGVLRRHRSTRWQLSLLAGLSLAFTTACGDEDLPPPTPEPEPAPAYEATIRRTAHGIPHIQGKDMGSLGYGQGYAFAKDHVCILADQILKVRGERAEHLGQGQGQLYAASDFAYRLLDLPSRARAALPNQTADLQALLKGYAAGFNRYLTETPAANLPQPCKGATWVKPINEVDLLAYHISVGLAASSYQLILAIAAAEPPGAVGGGSVGRPTPGSFKIERPAEHSVGSNGWALGKDKTTTGRGMVVANPHFPWEGELKLWESHLTVPGQLNVYGVGLMGVPAVLIGFNENVAWTHTFSSGQRMTLYRLPLVPGKPTSYMYEGQERAMTTKQIDILVKLPEGSLTKVTRTMYSSHYGPMMVIPRSSLPVQAAPLAMEWNTQYAYTLRDANIDNTALMAQFVGMDKAKSLQDFKSVYASVQGIPWVNTMAADPQGNVWYTDATPTPNLLPEAIAEWRATSAGADPQVAFYFQNQGLVLLDGSKAANEWQNEPASRGPGIVPFAKVPQLDRTDFVFNANDSYWLANPAAPLTGFSPMHGLEGVGQSPRTRMNAVLLTEVREDGASGQDGKFTRTELQDAILNNRSMTAELLRAQVVERCTGVTTVPYQTSTGTVEVNLQPACQALAGWNGRYDTDSVGAVMWREFAATYPLTTHSNGGSLYAVPFNVADPIGTPNTLGPEQGPAPVLTRLAQATLVLAAAGIPANAPLGDVQYTPRTGTKIPIHGGIAVDGTANQVAYGSLKSTANEAEYTAPRGPRINPNSGLTSTGYVINNGSSFIMAMEFTPEGPKGNAVLTYSESSDPASPYFADQTLLFSEKKWRPILFTEAEIAAATQETQTISGN